MTLSGFEMLELVDTFNAEIPTQRVVVRLHDVIANER